MFRSLGSIVVFAMGLALRWTTIAKIGLGKLHNKYFLVPSLMIGSVSVNSSEGGIGIVGRMCQSVRGLGYVLL